MALWQPGHLVADISGKLGNTVFARGSGPRVLRQAPRHRRPPRGLDSVFALRAQEVRRASPGKWPGGEALWANLALGLTKTDRFGQVRPLTAREAFTRFQMFWYARFGLAQFAQAARNQRPFVFNHFFVFALPFGVSAFLEYPAVPHSVALEFQGRYRPGAGRSKPSPWGFLATAVMPQFSTSLLVPLSAAWAARFGPLPVSFELELRLRGAPTYPRSFPSAWTYARAGTA